MGRINIHRLSDKSFDAETEMGRLTIVDLF